MKDAVGNELPKSYENSIQGRTIILADKLNKAAFELAHIHSDYRNKNDKKENILRRINEVASVIIEVKKEIAG